MSHLKRYPTNDSLRLLIPAETLAAKVADLSDHYRTEEIARFSGKVTSEILRTWANLYDELHMTFSDVEIGRDLTISRKATQTELEEIVLRNEASNRYYHPDEYPEYTDEDIAD